jgi:hypothetical protein
MMEGGMLVQMTVPVGVPSICAGHERNGAVHNCVRKVQISGNNTTSSILRR